MSLPERRITHVAFRLIDRKIVSLPPPARHPSLFLLCQKRGLNSTNAVQGFLDNKGCFLTREEAYKIADEAGQVFNRSKPGTLFSEDIW